MGQEVRRVDNGFAVMLSAGMLQTTGASPVHDRYLPVASKEAQEKINSFREKHFNKE